MSEYLTEKQEAVLEFIEQYQMTHGKSPTIREMKEHFKLNSDNSILKHLAALNEKGFIEKDDTPRGIKLLDKIKEKLSKGSSMLLPILGFIPAGGPIVTEEYTSGWLNVGEDLAKNESDYFVLKVTGESMLDAGILDGDLVVVNTKKRAKDKDIVVALIDNANTLKRYINKNGKVYLKAENKNYTDIYPINELVVQGVVTSVVRSYS